MAFTDEQRVQLETALKTRFFPYFSPLPNKPQWSEQAQKLNRLSRSLCAYALVHLTGTTDLNAVEAVVDGDEDNGLDAIYFDRASNCMYLVQSKYKRSNPDVTEVNKFIKGIEDLRAGHYENFNATVQLRESEIRDAFDSPGMRLCIVFCHLGEGIFDHASRNLNDLVVTLNKRHVLAERKDLTGEPLHKQLLEDQAPRVVTDKIQLEHYARTPPGQQPQVLYGQMKVFDLALLHAKHGKYLFTQNIREYLGSARASSVNEAIAQTLRETPELFLHYNNGITIVCKEITSSPSGKHTLEHLSIINGAQTVGTIAEVAQYLDLSDSPARVMVTVVEAQGIPLPMDSEGFERKVTRARNTQNEIKAADFVAYEPVQEELRRELALLGVRYVYKRGEAPTVEHLTSQQVGLALATLASTAEDALLSQRAPRDLINPDKAIYRRLFREKLRDLRASQVCRTVEIFKRLQDLVREREGAESAQSLGRSFYRNLSPLLIYLVGQDSEVPKGEQQALSEADIIQLSRDFERVADAALGAIKGEFLENLPGTGPKNMRTIVANNTNAEIFIREVKIFLNVGKAVQRRLAQGFSKNS